MSVAPGDASVRGSAPGGEPADDARATHLRRRRRQLWWVLGGGVVLAALVALLTGLVGLGGRLGAVSFLLVCALASAVTGVTALVTSMLDDLADRPVGRRAWLGGALLLTAFVLLGMVLGVAGA